VVLFVRLHAFSSLTVGTNTHFLTDLLAIKKIIIFCHWLFPMGQYFGETLLSTNIFKVQNKIIRIIAVCRSRGSCRDLFKNWNILPLASQYILSLLLFVINNRDKFKVNSDVRNINTRQKYNFHHPSSNLSIHQKGVYPFGISVQQSPTEHQKFK
jgi:hypothetical protein